MRLTKQCSKCKNICDLSAFSKRSRATDGLASECKSCHAIRDDQRLKHGVQRRIKAKLDYGKCDCHGFIVTVENLDQFEWDHIDPQDKKYVIGKMTVQTDKLFYAELAKCRLVCASFHVAHTREQRSQGLIGTNKSPMSSLVIQKPAHQESLFEGM